MLGQCILCQTTKFLCKSHIIPEFCYNKMYDEKHRAISYSPVTPEITQFKQTGVWSRLLCEDCEGKINDWYEKPFKKFWIEDDALAPLASADGTILTDVPYASFKLFHLSVLLRASESNHANFVEVELGAHLNVVRDMVRDKNPGSDSSYPICCLPIGKPDGSIWHAIIGPAHRIYLFNASGFYFTFAGAQWIYFVDGISSNIVDFGLKSNGLLPLVKTSMKSIELYRSLKSKDRD